MIFLKQEIDFLLTLAAVAVVAAVLLAYPLMAPIETEPGTGPIQFKEMPRFQNYAELKAAFEENQNYYGYGIMETMAGGIARQVSTPMAMDKAFSEVAEGSDDFSTTNVQVEGVDEADIVKSDGKYIYNFSNNRLVITDAYPIETAKTVSITSFEDISTIEMFVLNDKLLLFGQTYKEFDIAVKEEADKPEPDEPSLEQVSEMLIVGDRMPYYGSSSIVVRLYDISDRSSPKMEKELFYEGNYLTARLIEDNAYFVVNSWPAYRDCIDDFGCIIPLMEEDGVEKRVAEPVDIGYLPPMPAENFVTIASINLESKETDSETIAGSAANVFASQQNIYLASSVWIPNEGIVPEGTPVVDTIESIIIGGEQETVINKFGLVDGDVGYLGQGKVPGNVLNQFSMDEFKGNFRIATTTSQVSRGGSESTNNLYVLNEDMEIIGELEDLAPGERIYSARFMGNKAYMVTFRKIDPIQQTQLS